MKPLVSIVLPCYNAGKYLLTAVESVLNQSYQNIELIVVNDGSKDNSLEILENIVNKKYNNKSFSYYTTENNGQNAANNYGLNKAKGKYVKFFDADDFLFKDAIERQVYVSENLPEAKNYISFGYRVITNGNLEPIKAIKFKFNNDLATAEQFELLINRDVIVTACPLHKREILLTVDGFAKDVKHGNDFDLNLRIFLEGYKFHFDDIPIYYHRQHNSPDRLASDGWNKKTPNFGFELLERWEKLIENSCYGLIPEANLALANKHFKFMRFFIKNKNIEQSKLHLEKAMNLADGQQIKFKNSKLISYYYMLAGKIIGFEKVEFLLDKLKH